MTSRALLVLLGTVFFTAFAAAAGSHGGGHDHGTEAIGQPGQVAKVGRTVQIDMADTMRYKPSKLSFQRGETVRFVVKNSGQLKHEFVLGKTKDLKEHYELMKKFPEMEHEEPNMLSLAPGKTGELIWQFTKSGTVDFACLYPGHYEAGMKGAIKVSSASK